jgi:hypothetical protein
LEPYESGVKHICSEDNLKCAQCGGDHFSLDPTCPIIKNYKAELKRAVDNVLAMGSIKRTAPGETSQLFNQKGDDFSVLKAVNAGGSSGWHSPPTETTQLNLIKEVSELSKIITVLSDSMSRFETLFETTNK